MDFLTTVTLTFPRGRASATCPTQPPKERRDDRFGGPTPRGEYLIGKWKIHKRHGIDWYNLYPKKEDNSGYYPYRQPTRKGRSVMGLHPGKMSLGCVTVRNRRTTAMRVGSELDVSSTAEI